MFLNGIRSGHGQLKFTNGIIHSGIFVDGKIEGIGKIIQKNGDSTYALFKNGQI